MLRTTKKFSGIRIVNHANYRLTHALIDGDGVIHENVLSIGEVNTDPSLTIPDQVPPFQLLVDRFVRGDVSLVTAQQQTESQYLDEQYKEFSNIANMSKLDRIDAARAAQELVSDAQHGMNRSYTKNRIAALKNAVKPPQPPPGPGFDPKDGSKGDPTA